MEEEMMMKKKKKKEDISGMLSKLHDIEGVDDEELMMMQMGGVFSKLPGDIFYDILSRVPFKKLIQCRRVCKTWFKLICRPRFAELQYAKQIQTTKCSPFVVVANRFKDFFLVDSQIFDDFGTSTTAFSLEMKGIDEAYPCKHGFKRVFEVVGSVNGLICFADDHQMFSGSPYYICNPITGDHIILPLSPKYDFEPVKSGFGFSSTTNEYKVIRILKDENNKIENGDKQYKAERLLKNKKNYKAEAEIFTLGSDSWRRIESFPYPECLDQNLLLNGNLHWMAFENMELSHSRVIITFNVGTEELDVIQPPPYGKQQRDMFKDLRVLRESLCFIDNDLDRQIEVWVMKSYGVATSWVKEYVFKRRSNIVDLYWYNNYEVMKLRNGELLLRCGSKKLGYYNPNKGTFKPITIHGMPDVERPPIMLSGSFFSPKNVHNLRKR